MSDNPSRHPLRRDEPHLHGLRPPPLRLSNESRKIRKRQITPPPVIIYTVSPKTIHVDQNEFLSLVQRLTGVNSSSDTPPPDSTFHSSGGYPASVDTRVVDDGVEVPQNLLRHANDSNSLSSLPRSNVGLHGHMSMNSYSTNSLMVPEMVNTPSPSILDPFSSFPYN